MLDYSSGMAPLGLKYIFEEIKMSSAAHFGFERDIVEIESQITRLREMAG
jgi:hypothetical protein